MKNKKKVKKPRKPTSSTPNPVITTPEATKVTKSKEKPKVDPFQVSITPDFNVKSDYARVNEVFHRVIKAIGYPRSVEDGWLEAFLTSNEPYDISLHIHPSSISSNLVYLHNQIVKQTADLYSSNQQNTPNPSLEIKKNDTMKVYEDLYKGKEKMFQVSLYVDNQAFR